MCVWRRERDFSVMIPRDTERFVSQKETELSLYLGGIVCSEIPNHPNDKVKVVLCFCFMSRSVTCRPTPESWGRLYDV